MDQVICLKILLIVFIFDNWVFDNLISIDELFAKALRIFAICLLVNNSLGGKLISLSPIILDDNLKANSVSFFYCWLKFIKLWIW